MDTPRIPPITEPVAPSIKERLDRILPLLPPGLSAPQIYLTVARNEGLFNHIVDIGYLGPTGLMDRGAIDSALRELVILRTCVATGNASTSKPTPRKSDSPHTSGSKVSILVTGVT